LFKALPPVQKVKLLNKIRLLEQANIILLFNPPGLFDLDDHEFVFS